MADQFICLQTEISSELLTLQAWNDGNGLAQIHELQTSKGNKVAKIRGSLE